MTPADKEGLPRSRAEAKASGSKHYFTGKPCKYGHVSWRYTSDGRCSECARIDALARFYVNIDTNRARARQYVRERYAKDADLREEQIEYQRSYRANPANAEKVRAREQRRRNDRTEDERLKIRDYARDYQLKRHQSSPQARVNRSMAGGIYKSIKEGSKAARSWESLVGYTRVNLMSHLEGLFLPGMTWTNYGNGGWHIDHKRPKASFTYETPDDPQFRECWDIANLQPLWWRDNISKGSKYVASNDNDCAQSQPGELKHG